MGLASNSSTHHRPIVGVIGASAAEPSTVAIAEEIGRLIGEAGWHLLTGGGGGVMEGACRGFQSVKGGDPGVTIGILPSDSDESANPHVDIAIPTGMGITRNAIIARTAHGLIAVGGCAGTLSEIALAWQLGRPVAACVHSGGWAKKMAGIAIDNRYPEPIFAAASTRQAIDFIRDKVKISR